MNIVIIGISTGGPKTLRLVFNDLPPLRAAVLLVQHMPRFINDSFCRTLGRGTSMPVELARAHQEIAPGRVLVAPSETHLSLSGNRLVSLSGGEKVNFVCPAVDVTMESLQHRPGDRLVGVVMTGLGRDGANGIAHLKQEGGQTVAQDEASSVIWGMPKAAIDTGCVDHVLSPAMIRRFLVEHFG